MSATVVGISSGTQSGNTVVIPRVTGVQENDYLVAVVTSVHDGSFHAVGSVGSVFALVIGTPTATNGAGIRGDIQGFGRIATASEPADYTFDVRNPNTGVLNPYPILGALIAIRGTDHDGFVDGTHLLFDSTASGAPSTSIEGGALAPAYSSYTVTAYTQPTSANGVSYTNDYTEHYDTTAAKNGRNTWLALTSRAFGPSASRLSYATSSVSEVGASVTLDVRVLVKSAWRFYIG